MCHDYVELLFKRTTSSAQAIPFVTFFCLPPVTTLAGQSHESVLAEMQRLMSAGGITAAFKSKNRGCCEKDFIRLLTIYAKRPVLLLREPIIDLIRLSYSSAAQRKPILGEKSPR